MSPTTTPTEGTGDTAVVAGVETHYHDAGSGDAVLLLHGSGPGVSAWANWRAVLPVLSETNRVIAPDQIGFNKTLGDGTTAASNRERWTSHGLALMDHLGIERFSILGNSMGGAIAFSMAVARPQAVTRIAAMGTMGVPAPIPPGLDELWGYTPSPEKMERAIELLAYDQRINTPELVKLRYEASVLPGVDEAWQAMFPEPRQRWMDDLSLSPEELTSMTQPVLLVHGLQDSVIPVQNSVRLLDYLADVRLHVLGRCGHWVQIEQRDPFVRVVADFFGHS